MQRGVVGEIISRFERKGFVLKGLKLFQCPRALAEEHYKDLSAKPFFGALVDYIISGPVVAMVRAHGHRGARTQHVQPARALARR